MPRTNRELWDLFEDLRADHGRYIVFIEKVQLWQGDTGGGKQFRIAKMLSQYTTLITTLDAQKIPLVEVAPITWQKELGLHFPDEEKQVRKNRYKRFAAKTFPGTKPTLRTADALCLLEFGIRTATLRGAWVKEEALKRWPDPSRLFS